MATPKIIRSLIVIPDGRIMQLESNKHDQQTKLLEDIIPCLSDMANLLHLTTNCKDFALQSADSEINFCEALSKVVTNGTECILLAITHLKEIRRYTELTLTTLQELVESVESIDKCYEITDAIHNDYAQNCLTLSGELSSKFSNARVFIDSITRACTVTARNRNIESSAEIALTDAVIQLNNLAQKWNSACNFVETVASWVKAKFYYCTKNQAKTISLATSENHQKFAMKIFQTCQTVIRIGASAGVLLEVSEATLEEQLRYLQVLIDDAANSANELAEFGKKYAERDKAVAQIFSQSRAKLLAKFKKEIESLKQGEVSGEYQVILDALFREDTALDAAEKQRKMGNLLVAAPESIALLGRLCLLSSCGPDFQLHLPIDGFQCVKSDRFRPSLHQVVNLGSDSYAFAAKCLTTIEIKSKRIPDLVLDLFEVIVHGAIEDIQAEVPGKMKEVSCLAAECTKIALEVDQKFSSMVDLINELSVACTGTRSEIESKKAKAEPINDDEIANIRQSLSDGIITLSNVRRQWNDLVRFFNELLIVTKIEMFEPTDSFVCRGQKKAEKRVQKQRLLSEWTKEDLQSKARDAAQKGFQVHIITAMYLQISKHHLQYPLMSLDELLTITNTDQITEKLSEMTERCQKSQEEIRRMVQRGQHDIYTKFKKKLLEIEELSKIKDEEGDGLVESSDDEDSEDKLEELLVAEELHIENATQLLDLYPPPLLQETPPSTFQ